MRVLTPILALVDACAWFFLPLAVLQCVWSAVVTSSNLGSWPGVQRVKKVLTFLALGG